MIPGLAVKGGLVLALAVTLGGYTAAESATQRAVVADQQAQVLAAAEERRAAVEAERERAVATAQHAIADAAAVQTVAETAVAEADLVPLVEAVEELNQLLVTVPEAPLPALPGEDAAAGDESATGDVSGVTPTQLPAADGTDTAESGTGADGAATAGDAVAAPEAGTPVVEREARASRATATREDLTPATSGTTEATTEPAAEPAPTGVVDTEAAEQVEKGAADDAPTPAASDEAPDGGLDDATGLAVPADDAEPDDRLSADILAAVARVTEVAAQVRATADANLAARQAAEAAAAEAAAQAAAQAAAEAAEKAAQRASLDAYANGRVPAEALCEVEDGSGHQLRCDAAEALTELDGAYRAEFGTPLKVSDSYRSYAAQVACRQVKGSLCATPGTSNHGRGVAVDLAGGVQTFGTPQHRWMAANAGRFGWILPDWAQADGSKPEAWHWEYTG